MEKIRIVRKIVLLYAITFLSCFCCLGQSDTGDLPRGKVSSEWSKAAKNFYKHARAIDTPEIAQPYSIMVVEHGKVVFEQWYENYKPNSLFNVYSVSKTILALAVGCAVDEGRFSIEDKVLDFFPNQLPPHVSDTLSSMTIRHLLTMTCGLQESSKLLGVFSGKTDFDWIAEFFNSKQTSIPGTDFYYNFFSAYIMSAIVEKTTGTTISEYIKPRLLDPMHITDIEWEKSPAGICIGAWGLLLHTEDMAKFGQLLLQQGNWNGKQLVPSDWVNSMTSKLVDSKPLNAFTMNKMSEIMNNLNSNDHAQGYGYYVWQGKNGTIRLEGILGQYIIIKPEKEIVFVITSHSNMDQKYIDLIWKYFEHLM